MESTPPESSVEQHSFPSGSTSLYLLDQFITLPRTELKSGNVRSHQRYHISFTSRHFYDQSIPLERNMSDLDFFHPVTFTITGVLLIFVELRTKG